MRPRNQRQRQPLADLRDGIPDPYTGILCGIVFDIYIHGSSIFGHSQILPPPPYCIIGRVGHQEANMLIQSLEPRSLLSSVTYQNDILTIVGSPKRDNIRLRMLIDASGNGVQLTINGHITPIAGFPFSGSEPREIRIRAGSGNDSVNVSLELSGALTTVDGGRGNDHIDINGGPAGPSLILGGDGNDVLSSSPNRDQTIFGGNGNDKIIGNVESTEMHGGAGNDTLLGSSGSEKLFGDAGRDLLKGGDGIDAFFGGAGNDRIYSADANHNEIVDGGDGFDRVVSDQNCASATPVPLDELISIEKIICR